MAPINHPQCISVTLLRGLLTAKGWRDGISVVASIGGGWYAMRWQEIDRRVAAGQLSAEDSAFAEHFRNHPSAPGRLKRMSEHHAI